MAAVGVGIGVLGAGYFFRNWLQGGMCTSNAKMDGKTVVVTGANTGIGRETALDLAKRNAKVILACRDMKKGEEAVEFIKKESGNREVYLRELDLSSLESVRTFADAFNREEKRLDVLINNAGVMMTPQLETKDGFELQFGTNHLGHFLLTNLLTDKLVQSAPSRVVTVSSRAHTRGKMNFADLMGKKDYSSLGAYSQSKLANVLFSYELGRQLKDKGVTTYALHPGVVHSELDRHLNIPDFARTLAKPIVWYALKTSKQGAQTSINCAVNEKLASETGKYYSDCAAMPSSPESYDLEAARKLWEVSKDLVGL